MAARSAAAFRRALPTNVSASSTTSGSRAIERARELFLFHPPEYLLFGTDSPWIDQEEALRAARALDLGPERERRFFSENARTLLGMV